MKKQIISIFILLFLVIILGIFIYNGKTQRDNFFIVDNSIEKVVIINKDFNLYMKNSLSYENFDIVESKVKQFKKELKLINKNTILRDTKNIELKKTLEKLEKNIEKKYEIIENAKAYRAILNNSFRIIQKLKNSYELNNLNELYTTIMTLDKNPTVDLDKTLADIDNLNQSEITINKKYFLKHSSVIVEYQKKFILLENRLLELNIDRILRKLHSVYEKYTQESAKKAQVAIGILFILLSIAIILYLIYEYKFINSNKDLYRFRHAIENSDNIVVITDKNEIITYVNEAFTKTTGYTYDEAIGQKPSILKSDKKPQNFYDDLHETIHSGKKWSGEFINVDKYGNLSYEKASIIPVLNDSGEIYEFIAIKLDITNETVTREKLKEKEKLLIQQSKMASMGEMLENIAHQWRQPLSTISTASSGLHIQKELDIPITKEKELKLLDTITNTSQYLSQTIDDFRDFFNSNKEKNRFNLKDIYQKTLNLVNSKFISLKIEIIEEIQDIKITSLDNEIIQVIMNLLNNARDVLETKEDQKRLIFVEIYKDIDEKNVIIKIKDNAGGIPTEIIDKVFDPYFTTKHKSQGTGIGLYMCQEMIVKHMNGTICASNVAYTYDSIEYKGAEFKI
ncbi:MAG: ATP-binding protein, partial [Campylobacterota bacterium]|nr:ATP-binding protein [Campylobacterota bacterium]